MLARIFVIIVITLAAPTWCIGLAMPLGWLVFGLLSHIVHRPASEGLSLQWQLRLLSSSGVLIFVASLVATSLGAIAAYAFARIGRRAAIWCGTAILVIPPVIYGYLWYLALAGYGVSLFGLPSPYGLGWPNLTNLALAAGAIGLWLWPIPAVVLSVGWHGSGRPAWLLARLDATDLRAFCRAALPAMRLHLLAAFGACALLAAQEYATPALFSVQVWQTQWLTLAQAGLPLGRLALACLPGSALLALFLLPLACLWLAGERAGPAAEGPAVCSLRTKLQGWTAVTAILALSTVLPATGAMLALKNLPDFSGARYRAELINTTILTSLAATTAVAAAFAALPGGLHRGPASGAGTFGRRWIRSLARLAGSPRRNSLAKVMLGAAAAAWLLPAGVISEAAREAQITLGLPGRQIGMFVWVAVLAARLLPIAWVILMAAARALPAHLPEQAALDGATASQFALHILQPLVRPAAVAAWLVCVMLAAAETATASMLQQPGFEVLSVSLLNQMHYGRDAQVLAVCLVAMAAGAVVAIGVAVGLSQLGRGRDG